MRRKLHGPVVGRNWGGSDRWQGFRCRDRGRDRRSGGRVLSPGGGARLVLRAASGAGTLRLALRSLALRSLRTAPTTPTRHHPPETRPIPSNPPSEPRPRSRGLSSFTKSRRGSFSVRQTNVGGKRRWRRRRQQAWGDPKRQQNSSRGHEHHPSLRPPDPDTHPRLSLCPQVVSPETMAGRVGRPSERFALFGTDHSTREDQPKGRKCERGGAPNPSHPPPFWGINRAPG